MSQTERMFNFILGSKGVVSEADAPRMMSGREFLQHIDAVRACGNRIPLKTAWGEVDVLKWRLVDSRDKARPVSIYYSIDPDKAIFIDDLNKYKFIQKRINEPWEAIRLGENKTIDAASFVKQVGLDIFDRHYQPTIKVNGSFEQVLSATSLYPSDGITIYSSIEGTSEVHEHTFGSETHFAYDWREDAWSPDLMFETRTKRRDIRDAFDGVCSGFPVVVSGVELKFGGIPMRAKDLDVYDFVDPQGSRVYYHTTRQTKLEIKRDSSGVTALKLDGMEKIRL